MTMQQYKARYQSRYKMYTTSNHSIEHSCLHSMAQQGLPLLNGSFATRLRFTKMTDRYREQFISLGALKIKKNTRLIIIQYDKLEKHTQLKAS
jgi:hypothetical protein